MGSLYDIIPKVSKNIRVYIPGSGAACGISRTRTVQCCQSQSEASFVVSWILSGSGSYTEGDRRSVISANTVCIRRPDREYTLTIDANESVRLYLDLPECMYETFKLFIPELAYIPAVRPVVFQAELYEEFSELLTAFSSCQQTELYKLIPRISSFILNISGICDDRAEEPLMTARSMLADVSCRLTIEQIAERCGLNYNTFRKHFSDSFGISPYKYRTSCMIEAACQGLKAGEPIGELAERLGFTDVYGFTHRFTAIVGEAPAKYRKNNRG